MAGRLDGTPDVKGRRLRVTELCRSLPEAEVEQAGAQHLAFKVKKKIFGYYSYDHHGDGKIALWCKAPPGEQGRLVAERPDVYFVPAYVGPKGWVGIRLDTERVHWAEVKNHLFAALADDGASWCTKAGPDTGVGGTGAGSPPSNKGMKLTKLSAAWLPDRTCRLMPARVSMDAGTASQLIPGVRRTVRERWDRA